MVGGGLRGELNMLARCSLVDYHGNVVYDTYVAPTAHVWDYRTFISGIRHRDLVGGGCCTELCEWLWVCVIRGGGCLPCELDCD